MKLNHEEVAPDGAFLGTFWTLDRHPWPGGERGPRFHAGVRGQGKGEHSVIPDTTQDTGQDRLPSQVRPLRAHLLLERTSLRGEHETPSVKGSLWVLPGPTAFLDTSEDATLLEIHRATNAATPFYLE